MTKEEIIEQYVVEMYPQLHSDFSNLIKGGGGNLNNLYDEVHVKLKTLVGNDVDTKYPPLHSELKDIIYNFLIKPEPMGIGLKFKDGTELDYNYFKDGQTFDKNNVECILFKLEDLSLMISPVQTQCYFSNARVKCDNFTILSSNQYINLLNGEEMSVILKNTFTQDTTWTIHRACNTKLDGKNCYLGSLGEYYRIYKHKNVINDILTRCGLPKLQQIWSSSLGGRDTETGYITWTFGLYADGRTDNFRVNGLYYVLPIAKL